ncbi:MAG: YbgC/FadM family acyl-CoA thioesterase [Sphingomicrobium sp.]
MGTADIDQPYRGGLVGREHHFALSVYFEDTDAYGIVYYANYLRFMERARSDMIRSVGVDQFAELRATGSAYAVVSVDIRYRHPARLGDTLLVVSSIEGLRASSVDIQQRVMRSGQVMTDARVTAAFLDAQGRPRRQPKEWVDKFREVSTAAR